MAGIQFFGKPSVIKAYTSRGIAVWGLFQGKDLINSGDSEAQLSDFLDMLEPAGSSAVYTLKVFKNEDDPDEITDKTECNGSFRFKLTEGMGAMGGIGAGTGVQRFPGTNPIMSKIQGIIEEEVVAAIDKRLSGGKEEKEETFGDVIMGYLKDPDALIPIIGMIKNIFSPGSAAVGMPVRLAGVNSKSTQMNHEDTFVERLSAALDRLEKVDPKILEHLEKLAEIGERDPDTYRFLIKKLDLL